MLKFVHTNIISKDWKALKKFYESVFECQEVPPYRKQNGAWLEKGTGVPDASLEGVHLRLPGYGENGPTLEIYQYHKMENAPSPAANRNGIGHLAFEVDNIKEVAEAVLKAGGNSLGAISQTEIAGLGKIKFVYMTDPEGNIIEIQNWQRP